MAKVFGCAGSKTSRESMNNTRFLSTFAPGLGLWKCGKPYRVYHIPTGLFLYPKLVMLYAAGTRRDMCRLTRTWLRSKQVELTNNVVLLPFGTIQTPFDNPQKQCIPTEKNYQVNSRFPGIHLVAVARIRSAAPPEKGCFT